MKALHAFSAAILLTLAPAVAALAADPSAIAPAGPSSATNSEATKHYVNDAAIFDLFEAQASQIALQKSQNSDVKTFAQRMIDDHTKSTNALKQALSDERSDIVPPPDLDSGHKDMLAKLQDAPSSSFNRTYMDMQVEGHRQAVALHQNYAQSGDDPKLKALAGTLLPTVKEHLAMAERIDRSLATTTSYSR